MPMILEKTCNKEKKKKKKPKNPLCELVLVSIRRIA